MKNRIGFLLVISTMVAGCAGSVVKYDSESAKSGVIKVALGSKENVHVNDKVYLLERKCHETAKAPICGFDPIGTLTIKEVQENYSVVEPDKDLIFKEGYYFKFAMHCEDNAEKCMAEESKFQKSGR